MKDLERAAQPQAPAQPTEESADEPIAIIGMACRLPGADSPEALWQLLQEGRETVGEIPAERWDAQAFYDPDPATPGKMVTRRGGFLSGVDLFDAEFFGISSAEAAAMDPQQRLLLELAWHALEDAGHVPHEREGGVFLGICNQDYAALGPASRDVFSGTGNALSIASGRLSFQLGWQGPSLTLDTASSSSLVAVHLACQSLRAGECRLALAGGVNLILSPAMSVYMSSLGTLAPDGRSKAFAAEADGYVRSEGCALVVLKPLREAQRAGDRILAVVRGSAVNQDGRSLSLTAPSGAAQQALIQAALARAGVAPAQVSYLEAHGTGTPLGDRTEMQALAAALAPGRQTPVWVGSLKTNIGHAEAAAGVAGLIKTVLALHHRQIPAHLHFQHPSPHIPWSELPVRVPVHTCPWPPGPLVAGVSSFGLSGTNAHVIVEGPPPPRAPLTPGPGAYLLPLSARHPQALLELGRAWVERLGQGDAQLPDLVYNASRRRAHHTFRLAVAGDSAAELARALAVELETPAPPAGIAPRVVFVFSGQGGQWAGMGLGLLALEPFRRAMEECDGVVFQHTGWSLLEELRDSSSSRWQRTDLAQPLQFAVQVALAAQWRAWGIEPALLVGHSLGECAAAYHAGALTLQEAALVACRRGQLMQRTAGHGAMASVELSAEEAGQRLQGREQIHLASCNAPRSTLLSGDPQALESLLAELELEGVGVRRLKLDIASHSPQMDPLLEELRQSLRGLAPRPVRVPLVSTVTAAAIAGEELGPDYWVSNLRQPVRFVEAVRHIHSGPQDLFLEISPHPVLLSNLDAMGARGIPSLRRDAPERLHMLQSLGELYRSGCAIAWETLSPAGNVISLPRYPFQRQRYWVDETPGGTPAQGPAATPDASTWRQQLRLLPAAQGQHRLRQLVRLQAARVLGRVEADSLEGGRSFKDLGLDSLGSVQLRNALARGTGLALPRTLMFDYPSVDRVADFLAQALARVKPQAPAAPGPAAPAAEPIAIIGMGCRFPGAEGTEAFWRLLRQGEDAIQEVPASRWDVDEFYDPDPDAEGKMVTRWGGFLPHVDEFDADFFGIAPREAAAMDPQQRLLLEVAWEALQDALLPPEDLMGSPTGVFVGLFGNDYAELGLHMQVPLNAWTGTGNAHSVAAGRIAYLLGTQGPCLAVDTACSSSLAAVQLACQSLRRGECRLALAGGVNLILSARGTVFFSRLHVMAPDGRCKAFDAAADGYVRSEGCGMVVLKPLSAALAEGDRVLAVIRGGALNQDGRSNGLTAPNGPAQEQVVAQALAQAGLRPEQVGYVEAHGTGTSLGDPIEVQALGAALSRCPEHPLLVGSVKTNIGHSEAAAGVAGLIKTVLMLQHAQIPPHIHLHNPSPHIPWAELALRVPVQLMDWPVDSPRVAGISSFGFSGTNVHVIVEQAPALASAPAAPPQILLLPLSGHSPEALRQLARRWLEVLATPVDLLDLVHSAGRGRSHHPHRLALLGQEPAALAAGLGAYLEGKAHPALLSGPLRPAAAVPKVVFVFPGQGSQWLGMGRELLGREPVFRQALQECDAAIRAESGWSLLEELQAPEQDSRLAHIEVVQPVLFAMQVALSALWRSWGVEPDAVVGHSMGEIAAAQVAGALSLPAAVTVICRRSQLLRRVSGQGAMAVVDLSMEEAEERLGGLSDRLSVAVSNSPRSTVLSGQPRALESLLAELEEEGIFCRRIKVDVASHSPQMDPLQPDLLEALSQVRSQTARVPIYSTVTTHSCDGSDFDAAYWVRNLRAPVQFAAAVRRSLADGHRLFVEISPHPILLPALESMLSDPAQRAVASLRREMPERACLLESLGRLYCQGYPLDWKSLGPAGRKVSLPSYPWQRRRYWLEAGAAPPVAAVEGHPLLGPGCELCDQPGVRVWESRIDVQRLPWLADHRVEQAVVFPAAALLEMALGAAGAGPCRLQDFRFPAALLLESPRQLQLLRREQGRHGSAGLRVCAREQDGSWTLHAEGQLAPARPPQPREDLATIQGRCPEHESGSTAYARLAAQGLPYGAAFQGIEELWRGSSETLGRIRAGSPGSFVIPPTLLDACFQLLLQVVPDLPGGPYVPVGLEALNFYRSPGSEVFCHARLESLEGGRLCGHLAVADPAGELLFEVMGLSCQALSMPVSHAPFLRPLWEAQPLPALGERGPGGWLLMGAADSLAAALRERGQEALVVEPGQLAAACRHWAAHPSWRGVVYLEEARDGVGLDLERQVESCWHFLETVRTLSQTMGRAHPRLWLVTRGPALQHAALLGLARTVAMEHPELRCSRLDLCPHSPPLQGLLQELLADSSEEELALRGGQRYVARLGRVSREELGDALLPRAGRDFQVQVDSPGRLDGCGLRAARVGAPGPGQVSIEVEVAGLNFKDVLTTLGLVPPHALQGPPVLGLECAGRVAALGPGVEGLQLGQAVVAVALGALASRVNTPAALVVPMPPATSAQDAATLPIVHLTAYYALHQLARLQPGERVLIHSAAGGVGQAAIQWAQHVGAEIYASAGSPAKRELLRHMGVQHVSDSRSADFVKDILEWTQGGGNEGVDVVLNSLAGPLMEDSLKLLRDHGRFIELGLRDSLANSTLGLRPFLRNLSFSLVDLAAMIRERPAQVGALLREVMAWVEKGVLRPLPCRVYPLSALAEALNDMAQGKHTGKLLVSLDDAGARVRMPADASLDARASYLISGGVGGLGLSVARWMVGRGARHLLLLSRRGAGPEALLALQEMRAAGAEVEVACADVADRPQLQAVLGCWREAHTPVRGVVHAAGVLQDALLSEQTRESLRAVLAPKVAGAWNLHELTAEDPLDFFVMYSSVAALLGLPGQGNYAAANAFLDALAHDRRAQGRPALSLNWGPFSQVGMAVDASRGQRLQHRGLGSLTPEQGLEALESLLMCGAAQVAVAPLNARQWVEFYPQAASWGLLSSLLGETESRSAESPLCERIAAESGRALPLLEQFVCEQLAQVLRLPAEAVDGLRPFKSMGVDSLMGLELRNRLEAGLGLRLQATLLWTYPHVAALAEHLLNLLQPASETPAPPSQTRRVEVAADLEELSEDEVAALMKAELSSLRKGRR